MTRPYSMDLRDRAISRILASERSVGRLGIEHQRGDSGALVTALPGIGKYGSGQGRRSQAAASGGRVAQLAAGSDKSLTSPCVGWWSSSPSGA